MLEEPHKGLISLTCLQCEYMSPANNESTDGILEYYIENIIIKINFVAWTMPNKHFKQLNGDCWNNKP